MNNEKNSKIMTNKKVKQDLKSSSPLKLKIPSNILQKQKVQKRLQKDEQTIQVQFHSIKTQQTIKSTDRQLYSKECQIQQLGKRLSQMNTKLKKQQNQLILKVIQKNKIFQDLNFPKSYLQLKDCLEEISITSKYLWFQTPTIVQTKPNQIYFILAGKAFEYINNQSEKIKLKIKEDNDYLMIRKLQTNDYFLSIPHIGMKYKTISKQKYQLMVDQKVLLLKINTAIYSKHFQQKLYQRIKAITIFMKQVTLFQNLSSNIFIQLNKFVKTIKVQANFQIIRKGQKSRDIYLIKEGLVRFQLELKSYNQTINHQNILQKNSHFNSLQTNNHFNSLYTQTNNNFNSISTNNNQWAAQTKSNQTNIRISDNVTNIRVSDNQNNIRISNNQANIRISNHQNNIKVVNNQSNIRISNDQNNIIMSNNSTKTQVLNLTTYHVFGMDTLHTLKTKQINVNYSATSLKQCEFYCIDKRILAIVISSYQEQTEVQQKPINSIHLNEQIKGQNYQSQRQQLLSQNVQRIKISQKKVRDYKLRSYSRKKSRDVNTYIPEKDRIQQIQKINLFKRTDLKRRSCSDFKIKHKFQNNFEVQRKVNHLVYPIDNVNQNNTRSMLITSTTNLNQFQKNALFMTARSTSILFKNSSMSKLEKNSGPKLEKNQKSKFERNSMARLDGTGFSLSNMHIKSSLQSSLPLSPQKSFIPKIPIRSSLYQSISNPAKLQSQILHSYLDKKIKNQIIKKAQQVLERKSSTTRNIIKNIKKFYNTGSPDKIQIVTKSQKEITGELFQRMTNIKEYPLLCKIETQRKRMEARSKGRQQQYKTKATNKNTNNNKIKPTKIIILHENFQNKTTDQGINFSSAGSQIDTQKLNSEEAVNITE